MTRPCGDCNKGASFEGPWRIEDQCRFCWLYANDERYKAYWNDTTIPEKQIITIGKDCVQKQRIFIEEQTVPDKIPDEAVKEVISNEEKYPSKIKQAISLATATSEWVKEGQPIRSDEECSRIHKICEACPHFNAKEDRCKRCGCGLSAKASTAWIYSVGIPDGIRMATHSCPDGRW